MGYATQSNKSMKLKQGPPVVVLIVKYTQKKSLVAYNPGWNCWIWIIKSFSKNDANDSLWRSHAALPRFIAPLPLALFHFPWILPSISRLWAVTVPMNGRRGTVRSKSGVLFFFPSKVGTINFAQGPYGKLEHPYYFEHIEKKNILLFQ